MTVLGGVSSRLSLAHDRGLHESQPAHEFLKERIVLFSKISLLICFGFYLFTNLIASIGSFQSWINWFDRPRNGFLLSACLVFLGMWGLVLAGKASPNKLRSIETAGTFLVCVFFAFGGGFEVQVEQKFPFFLAMINTLLGTTNVLIGRAIIVPSEAWRTFLIGTISLVPILYANFFIVTNPLRVSSEMMLLMEAGLLLIWGMVAVVASTVASNVIFGLHREVKVARQLGQYTLEEKIGAGSMGEVYRAHHSMLRRPTAIKLLRRDRAGEKSIARFEREVRLTCRLTHPNTVAIYDYGRTPDGTFFYAMEYLAGITLERLVEIDGPQKSCRVIYILKQVCASLAEAHSIGLIHRDIKAANVILCERGGLHDVTKVVDFGLVKDLDNLSESSMIPLNEIAGTPLYISPEAIRSPGDIDARSDLYSVGVLGYFMVTGKPVFKGDSATDLFNCHLHTEPTPPSARSTMKIPKDLELIILQCLEKDPRKRPADAVELYKRLDSCESARDWGEAEASRWWQSFRGKKIPLRSSPAEETVELPDLADLGGKKTTSSVRGIETVH